MDTDRIELEITDEGQGFAAGQVAQEPLGSDVAPQCGRGLPLILLVMDEVHFNEKGNQIRMALRKK